MKNFIKLTAALIVVLFFNLNSYSEVQPLNDHVLDENNDRVDQTLYTSLEKNKYTTIAIVAGDNSANTIKFAVTMTETLQKNAKNVKVMPQSQLKTKIPGYYCNLMKTDFPSVRSLYSQDYSPSNIAIMKKVHSYVKDADYIFVVWVSGEINYTFNGQDGKIASFFGRMIKMPEGVIVGYTAKKGVSKESLKAIFSGKKDDIEKNLYDNMSEKIVNAIISKNMK